MYNVVRSPSERVSSAVKHFGSGGNVPMKLTPRMSRDEQRVNAVDLKPLAFRAARHRLNPFVGLLVHPGCPKCHISL
jgi:hypothetical protein